MKKKRATLTPINLSTATPVAGSKGKSFRKQILPFGSINYKGTRIEFTRDLFDHIVTAFKGQAYDQVPIVLADGENRHNMDPTKFAGEVTNFSVESDGLWADVTPSDTARRLIEENPRLGVSARIVPGLTKDNGRRFDFAIQHVLLTMDPRVTGMKPWQMVDLSAVSDSKVVDLSALTIQEDDVATTTKKSKVKVPVPAVEADETVEDATDVEGTGEAEDAEDAEEADNVDEDGNVRDLTEEEVDNLLEEDEVEDEGEDEEDDEDAEAKPPVDAANPGPKVKRKTTTVVETSPADLSADADAAFDLANAAGDATLRDQVQSMRIDLANSQWENERKGLIREGVPPFLLDLAAPILSTPDAVVIDLATSEEPVDAKVTIRNLLSGVKGMIDFTPEMGHAVDLSTTDTSADAALLEQWNNYGTV